MAAKDKIATVTEPIFTINDFPTEIIERFAPDLRPRTVSSLRLVSPRFRDVFTSDRYYKSYLWYGKRKEFYCEDLEQFGEARNRWRRCLEAEKRRLDNWRQGRPTRVETVRVPSDLVSEILRIDEDSMIEWHGEIGEGNNYWMMSELVGRKILLANVTANPIMTVVDVSRHTPYSRGFSHLLADQVIIDSPGGSKRIFNILNDGSKLTLKLIFTIEAGVAEGVYISGTSIATREYRKLYISPNLDQGGVLSVWDLKGCVEKYNIVLSELLPPHRPVDFLESCKLYLKETEFPFVLVTVKKHFVIDLMYLVVNVEEKCVDCSLPVEGGLRYVQWFVKGRELFVEFIDEEKSKNGVRIYDLRPGYEPSSAPRLLFHLTWYDDLVFESLTHSYEPPLLITCNICTNSLTPTHVDEPEFQSSTIYSLQMGCVTVVGPFLIVNSSSLEPTEENECPDEEEVLMTFDTAGTLLLDLTKMLKAKFSGVERVCLPYYSKCNTLSKCVLQNGKGDALYIYHF